VELAGAGQAQDLVGREVVAGLPQLFEVVAVDAVARKLDELVDAEARITGCGELGGRSARARRGPRGPSTARAAKAPAGSPARRRKDGGREAKAEARAEAILEMLEARGLSPSETLRQRILATTDLDQLGRGLRGATLADSAEEILNDP
jgi:hypothetical protein